MICSECYNDIKPGERYRQYTQASGFEVFVHLVGCEGVFRDKQASRLKRLRKELNAIEKQCLDETPAEVDAYLRAAGYDPEALSKRLRKVIKKAMDESPLNPKNKPKDTTS